MDKKYSQQIELNNTYVIEIYNLTKKYKMRGKKKEITALNNINLKIKKGEIFGLLGPNGAGKTTMVSILTTLIQPTSGTANILGYDLLKHSSIIKENVGLMLGGDMIYHRLTGYRNLMFFGKLYNIKNPKDRISELAEVLGLSEWLNQYVENYSTGMKVKLALARTLLGEPKILFLDEPLLGLDPNIVKNIINLLLNLKKTIFLTSHQMNVVQAICDRIAFLKEGEIIKVDTQENFKNLTKDQILMQIQMNTYKIKDFIDHCSTIDYIKNIRIENDKIYFNIESQKYYPDLFSVLQKYPIIHISEIQPNLEEVFIRLSS